MKSSPKMIAKIRQIIRENKRFAIFFHLEPDGDAVGSAVGLGIVLKKVLKKEVYIFYPHKLIRKYARLDTLRLVTPKLPEDGVDVVFLLDSSEEKRLAGINELKSLPYKLSVNIDHHLFNQLFADINYVDTQTSSVGEMIYGIVKCWEIPLEAAEALYAAILTDTGRFTFQNTSARTLKVASELISIGVKPHKLALQFYYSYPIGILKEIGNAFLQARILMDGKLIILHVDSKAHDDIGSIVDFSLLVNEVEVSVLLRERSSGFTEAVLRSKSFFDVGELAVALGGGGHKNAGGCTIHAGLKEAEKIIVEEITKRGL